MSAHSRQADLHVHTKASDGAWPPRKVVRRAAKMGLRALAITDHDTTAGVSEAVEAGRSLGVEVIAGVELSTRLRGREVHILGLFIDTAHDELAAILRRFQDDRARRARRILEKLAALGAPVELSLVQKSAGAASVGRVHIAKALVAKGHVPDIQSAFERYLGNHAPAYVERFRIDPAEAVTLVQAAGGVAVLAHPGLLGDDQLVARLAASGLDGLEVRHSKHTADQAAHYAALATQYGLIPSGGSDCHGPLGSSRPLLGSVTVGLTVVERMRRLAKQRSGKMAFSCHNLTEGRSTPGKE